jgi:hypothetical protein
MRYRRLAPFTRAAMIAMTALLAVEAAFPNALERRGEAQFYLGVAAVVADTLTRLAWSFFAVHNAAALGARGMTFTRWTAIGWYLIPFAFLFMPYRALAEAWRASAPTATLERSSWGSAPGPRHLLAWWILWWLSFVSASPDLAWRIVGHCMYALSIICFAVGALALERRQAERAATA